MLAFDEIHHGDCLEVMRQLPGDSVDLVATDPPFGKGVQFKGDSGEFNDRWSWSGELARGMDAPYRDLALMAKWLHGANMGGFVQFMVPRLLEVRRVLKPTGSCYLQCDPTASPFLRLLLDAVFGAKNFRNEIVWCYDKGGVATKYWKRNHDSILFFTKSKKYSFAALRIPTKDGKFEMRKPFKTPNGAMWHPKEPGKQIASWWSDIPSFGTSTNSKERVGYPTQKPIALYDRMVRASSNPDDIVLDPFMGSGTTLVAAKRIGRRYIGIDESAEAVRVAGDRLAEELL